MDVNVVVLHFGPQALTDACLASVGDAPVTLVDNSVENRGFAAGCNFGASQSDSEFLVFLNNDATVEPGWLNALLAPFSDLKVGIVGPRIVYPDGRLQHAGIELFYDRQGVLTATNVQEERDAGEAMAVTGACMAVRRDCFDSVEGFDEGFRNGYEDVDICLRAQVEGWKVRYTPDTTVTHIEAASGPERWTHVQHNIARLHDRWANDKRA